MRADFSWYDEAMDFAPGYLIQRFFYRIYDFFHHWYVDGSRAFGHRYIKTLGSLDQTFAVKITLRHFAEPLYRDYSVIGRILGVIFRTGRILIGGVIYIFMTLLFAAIYLAWLIIPIAILAAAFFAK